MRSKIIGTICLVLGIVIIVSTGTSFAYFTVTVSSNGEEITGATESFDVDLSIDTVYKATQLIPLDDTKITSAITKTSDKCIDNKGYQVCSLYTITLTNNGEAQILNGYITTESTTYTSNHLKCQLFDTDYNSVSDEVVISTNTTDKVYFKKDTNNVATEINNTDVTYYLVVWLSEAGTTQNEDINKTFTGKVAFESLYGSEISATFTS